MLHKAERKVGGIMKAVSIIVPTLNEEKNIAVLLRRIAHAFSGKDVHYEIIFIDDHSRDDTVKNIQKLQSKYPVRLYQKTGHHGKAFSLLQGFKKARYDVICMIDADLQYPPEAILPMYNLLDTNQVDVILSDRNTYNAPLLRKISTKMFNLLFVRALFGFSYDTQSGLKLFRKRVVDTVRLSPTPWSFDLEFIVRSLEHKFKILSYGIAFSERYSGEAKVKIFKVTYELALASIKLRLSSSKQKILAGQRLNSERERRVHTA